MSGFSWGSAAIGVALGAFGATAALLFITISGPGERVASEPGGDETEVSAGAKSPAASGSGAGASPSPRAPAGPSRPSSRSPTPSESPSLVAWLSEKLQEAYRRESLPEIIGTEAGAEAADQVYDYILDGYDTDTVRDLLDDVLERPADDLGLDPTWELDGRLDCSPAPCIARVDLSRADGSFEGCEPARAALIEQLKAAIQPGSVIAKRAGECSLRVIALSEGAQARQAEIEAGITGFLDNYFSEAEARLDGME